MTMFGVYGPWMELPDVFAPILWIDTTSSSAIGLQNGLKIVSATTIGGADTSAVLQTIWEVQVDNYEPGTKWFLPDDCGSKTAGSALGMGLPINGGRGVGPRLWKLFYRSVGEGPDPNRMQ